MVAAVRRQLVGGGAARPCCSCRRRRPRPRRPHGSRAARPDPPREARRRRGGGERPGVRVYGLCYLELNAALGVGLGTDWPVAVDHASTLETSWLLALEPSLVAVDSLPDDREAAIEAVYGPNPRFTADATRGRDQVEAAAALLSDRVLALLAGGPFDPLADLRAFVAEYWPESLVVEAGADGLRLRNPGAVSRYLSPWTWRSTGARSTLPRSASSTTARARWANQSARPTSGRSPGCTSAAARQPGSRTMDDGPPAPARSRSRSDSVA